MINLPFNKWTLKFHSQEYETQYEEHLNKIRVLSFKIINYLLCIASIVCLIIFLIQRQSTFLVIIIISIICGCFSLSILTPKLQPYMKQVFSIMHVWGTFNYIMINFSDIEVPHYVFGYSTGLIALGVIQYSDNRLKIVYILATPTLQLAVFNLYKLNTLQFVVFAYTCMLFVGTLAYMNEYTSRLAFSFNLIAIKQQEIINQFVQDTLFAVSLNTKTLQFELEFQNKKAEQEFDLNEQLKTFLRSSYLTQKQSVNLRTSADSKKQLSLEEFLYTKIKQNANFSNFNEILPEVCITDKENKSIKKMQIQIKMIDFGKPLLLIIVKSDRIPQLLDNSERMKKQYQGALLNQSKDLVMKQIQLYHEIKKVKINSIDSEKIVLIQCLNLSFINTIRNSIIYLQRDKIYNSKGNYDNFNLQKFLLTLEEYFHRLANHFHYGFELVNQTDADTQIILNNRFLTQIMINVFDLIVSKATKNSLISLLISIHPDLHIMDKQRIDQSCQSSFNSSSNRPKLISFSFCYYSNHDLLIQPIDPQQNIEYGSNTYISQYVTNLLLDLLGPYNKNQLTSAVITQIGNSYFNKIQFYIYADQSLLGTSFTKQIEANQNIV